MGGKSKSTTVGYWYEIAFHSGLGVGPIDAYLEFRGGDKTAWKGEARYSQTIHINAPSLWGGEKDQGGIVGSVDLMFGEPTQQPNSRLARIFGSQQPAWRGLATLAFSGKYGAMNPYPQKASHKILKVREGWDGECWYPGKAAIPMPSCAGADPYIHVTSLAYPVATEDAMQFGIEPVDGLLKSMVMKGTAPAEAHATGLLPTGGVLRSALQRATAEADSTFYALAPTGGRLLKLLKTSRAQPDGGSYSTVPTGGRIRAVPKGTQRPDATIFSLAPTGGSLK